MHFSFPSTTLYIVVTVAQFLMAPAHADNCDSDCSTVASKLLNCGSEVDFPIFPKLDAAIDSCLCTNETINAFRGCENCRSIHMAIMSTDKLIVDCKRADPSRTYVATNNTNNMNNTALNNRSMATKTHTSGASALVAIVAVGFALSLS